MWEFVGQNLSTQNTLIVLLLTPDACQWKREDYNRVVILKALCLCLWAALSVQKELKVSLKFRHCLPEQ